MATIRGPRRLYVLPLLLSSSIFISPFSYNVKQYQPRDIFHEIYTHVRPFTRNSNSGNVAKTAACAKRTTGDKVRSGVRE